MFVCLCVCLYVCLCFCVCDVETSTLRHPRAVLSCSATGKNNRPLSLNSKNISGGLVEAPVDCLLPQRHATTAAQSK